MTEIAMTADEQALRCFVLGVFLGVIIGLGWPSVSSLMYDWIKGFIGKVVKEIEKEDNRD